MALQKQAIDISFAKGVDTKIDPKRIQPGKFLQLTNSVFDSIQLKKRNGFEPLASLPTDHYSYVTTFNDDLTAIGTNLSAYIAGPEKWVTKGTLTPLELSTLSIYRSNTTQTYVDAVVSSNGLVCSVFTDNIPTAGSNVLTYKYIINDSATGQNVSGPTTITSTGTITYAPKIYLLGNYFIIVFDTLITATNHLQYISINLNTFAVTAAADLSAQYTPASTGSFDGIVVNNNLYIAWNGSDGGGAIRMTYLSSHLAQGNTVTFATKVCTIMSLFADTSGPTAVIYAAFYNLGTTAGYILAVNPQLVTILAPTQWIAAGTILNVTGTAISGVATILYETSTAYSYDSGIKTNIVSYRTCTVAGSLGTATVLVRSVGLASKAFLISSSYYFLGAYNSLNQSTYFLFNSSGNVIAKLAYSNGGGYVITSLASVSINNGVINVPYLLKDLLIPVNKTQGATISSTVYAQTGINLASFILGTTNLNTAEIGNNLHITGGILWGYDGYIPVEHGFFLWPDYIEVAVSHSGGSMTTQDYYYQAVYEFTDFQGNIFRSAPSIPVIAPTASFTGSSNSVTVNVPYLRLTYKTATPVKIVIYRWSTAQQSYFQVTSTTIPQLNVTNSDSLAFVDTLADSSIIGNSLIYTTGGVVENIASPPASSVTLFKSRLFVVDAEDKNLIWFSKQVIQSMPVELSDLFTIYISPSSGNLGSAGPIVSIFPLDDKLIAFRSDSIIYITGNGPDNTGANNDFSQPFLITTTVGCSNPNSIVSTPLGLMFKSNKGIWLLGRDLSTTYIGADIQSYDNLTINSALTIPGTNQVRFMLNNDMALMYDYYYQQWGTFNNLYSVSSTLYQGAHTYIHSQHGIVCQETPGIYVDCSNPTLLSFTTGWISLAGVQGYQRCYYFTLLGTYLSPHKLSITIAYDYEYSPTQSELISPDNFSANYGDDTLYGGGKAWGGIGPLEQWRVFFNRQKCQAIQITFTEVYDGTFSLPAGAGFTLTGLNIVVGLKKPFTPISAVKSIGT